MCLRATYAGTYHRMEAGRGVVGGWREERFGTGVRAWLVRPWMAMMAFDGRWRSFPSAFPSEWACQLTKRRGKRRGREEEGMSRTETW